MKCLARNKVKFSYANVSGKVACVDTQGYATGEYRLSYTTPVSMLGNISPATGNSNAEMFGVNVKCDKVVVLDQPNINISESSILWVDNPTTDPYDYIVTKIARSLNSVAIAITKVEVNA